MATQHTGADSRATMAQPGTNPPEGALLVTGASGLLGPHVVAACARLGPVLAACREPDVSALLARLGLAPALVRDRVRPLPIDFTEPEVLEAALAAHEPRAVVFAAALARVDECEREPVRARRLNALAPEVAARWCSRSGARLVHVSTDLVFGGELPPSGGFAEEAAPAPVSVYGLSKAEGETRVLQACPAALVVRLPLLYGDSGGRGLGASDALIAALERGEEPGLFLDEWRTPLAVPAAAAALRELVDRSERGVLHVAGPERLSRFELGLHVLAARGVVDPEQRLAAISRAQAGMAHRPPDVSLNSERARSILTTCLRAPADEL